MTPKKLACLVLACCISSLLLNPYALGQSADDVHVVPRTPSDQPVPPTNASPANNPSAPDARINPIKVDVDLVLVPVVVTDAKNRPVLSLRKRNFELYEEDKRQEIRYFMAEDAPISIAVLFDVSKSMRDKIDTERAAIHEFSMNANPEDEYFAIGFSDHPRLLEGPTQSIDDVEQKLTSIEPGGSTSMLDAIYLAESELRSARYQRKAIIIFSDGGDNASRYTLREIKRLVAESDVQIYAIGLFETFFFNTVEERLGKKWLNEITDKTGGRTITVEKRANLAKAAGTISREMRNQYVLGYRPAVFDGKWRKIRVKVTPATPDQQIQASYKRGYYSAER
jgi:Ca-activated chloride channel family protein